MKPELRKILWKVSGVDLEFIEARSDEAIADGKKITISYLTQHIFNILNKDSKLLSNLNNFNHIHSEGIGIFFARKILCKDEKNKNFNWTDSASKFLKFCEGKGYSIYFVGSTTKTIERAVENIKSEFPLLNICGWNNGFNDLNDGVIEKINLMQPNILWVGLGSPKQEMWIAKNYNKLNCDVIHAVGDVFALFAKTKRRGPVIIQKLGLEWFVRLLYNPKRYWKRYVLGIPVFLFIVIGEKIKQL